MDSTRRDTKKIFGQALPRASNEDERWMLKALRLAEQGRGSASPNPLVGAVVVRDGKAVGSGYHMHPGGDHAEVSALRKAGALAKGATLYVTLEPCNHFGRTPPCTDEIMKAKISKVIYGARDTNPSVTGGGCERLRRNGVEVVKGPFEWLIRRQNEAFFKSVERGLPFVTLKMALSLDGKVATASGKSKWITGGEARKETHLMRAWNDAVMVGIGTVLADDPLLTPRVGVKAKRFPVRVVVDSNCRIPLKSKVVTDKSAKTIVAVSLRASGEKITELEERGVEVLRTGGDERVDLIELLTALNRMGIRSVLLEGGSRLAGSFLAGGLIDKVVFFIAPIIIGGRGSYPPFDCMGVADIESAWKLEIDDVSKYGDDLKVVAYTREGKMNRVYGSD